MAFLREFLLWWTDQLRGLSPAGLRGSSAGPANALVVALKDGSTVAVSDRRRRREVERLRFDPALDGFTPARRVLAQRRRDLPIVLRPPSALLLEREASLPLAASSELGRVLAYEMDRFTPFRADEVFWSYAVLARDKAAGVLRLRLSVVPRAPLAVLTDAVAATGAPTLLEFPVAGGVRIIAIERHATTGERRRRRALTVGVWACAALALAAVVQPFVRQSLALGAADDRIAALRPQVARIEALRRRIASASNGADTIAREAARLGDPLQILAAVTAALPDDTFLTALGLHEHTLTMEGQSGAAAKLIGRLANDPLLREPAFTAPVTRTDHGADLFALRAKIAP